MSMESDHELAFRLQMEEAFAASLSSSSPTAASSSSSLPEPPATVRGNTGGVYHRSADDDLWDRELSEADGTSLRLFVHEAGRTPDVKWEERGDHFQAPLLSAEGSSSSGVRYSVNHEPYRLYFKGLLSEESVDSSMVTLCGIGIAICDTRDNLIFELRKPIRGVVNRKAADLEALLEGLAIAFSMDLKRLVFYCDYHPIYQYAKQNWYPKQRKVATLVDKVMILQRKFVDCSPYFIPTCGIKYAIKFARDAIASEMPKPESSCGFILRETCVICLEERNMEQMFCVTGCLHSYCFSCMKQHVEVKLFNGIIPKCPHDGCTSELSINSCEKFLTPKLIEIMKQRLKEASIPSTDKVYCPFPRCSELMSKSQASAYARKEAVQYRNFGERKCVQCSGLFCINCKLPWHFDLRCKEYKRLNPSPSEDTKLKSLASTNLWRQCVKCKHMIELAEGCYHMTCRCGHEFCYTCGAEWETVEKEKKPTCSCPLFNDDYGDGDEEDYDSDLYDYYDGYYYTDSDSDLF